MPDPLDQETVDDILRRVGGGETPTSVARALGVGRRSVYRVMKRAEQADQLPTPSSPRAWLWDVAAEPWHPLQRRQPTRYLVRGFFEATRERRLALLGVISTCSRHRFFLELHHEEIPASLKIWRSLVRHAHSLARSWACTPGDVPRMVLDDVEVEVEHGPSSGLPPENLSLLAISQPTDPSPLLLFGIPALVLNDLNGERFRCGDLEGRLAPVRKK